MDEFTYIVLVAIYSGIVYFTGNLARDRGRDRTVWTVLAVFFSFFATILLLLLPDLSKQQPQATAPASPPQAASPPVPAPAATSAPATVPTSAPIASAPPASSPPAVSAPVPPPAPAPVVAPAPPSPPPAAPAVVAAPPTVDPPFETDRRPCPRCGESIAEAAKICRFCGLDLSKPSG